MLYIELTVKTPGVRQYGYADDIALLQISADIKTVLERTKNDYQHMLRVSEENSTLFNPSKTECQLFIKQRRPLPEINIEGLSSKPMESIRWLGVHLDRKLLFSQYIRIWTN